MKRKLGTILDEEVIHRAKMVAAAERRSLAAVVEDALRSYLAHHQTVSSSVVLQTAGLIKSTPGQVKRILELDPYDR